MRIHIFWFFEAIKYFSDNFFYHQIKLNKIQLIKNDVSVSSTIT